MHKPLIGVTTRQSTSQQGYPQFTVSKAYMQALINANACPVAIPSGLSSKQVKTLISKLEGVLFSGGGDIHPDVYHGSNHPKVNEVDVERDEVEIQLFHHALEVGIPIFGICRGLQLINVAMGGTLYEDIIDQHPNAIQHKYYPDWPREYLAHTVEILAETRLSSILKQKEIRVNSLHHQGIRDLANGLTVSALATDGIIEAVEIPEHDFAIAVQWHPENLQDNPLMRTLFQVFVQAARE